MTLAVYYCSKQKQWYYEKHKIRMTQMTLMTLNLGYGIGISSKQRHKRHLRHYRHRKKCAGGLGYTPEMCMWMTTCYASKTYSRPKRGQSNRIPIQIHIRSRVNQFRFIPKSWLEKVNQLWFTLLIKLRNTGESVNLTRSQLILIPRWPWPTISGRKKSVQMAWVILFGYNAEAAINKVDGILACMQQGGAFQYMQVL